MRPALMGGGGTSQAANDPSPTSDLAVRELTTIHEMHEAEAIQREVWGLPDIDVVPASQMKAAAHAGGHVAGAFEADAMIGFAYALVATPHDADTHGVGLHSHMVAVREQGRRRGTGKALKWFQRTWCLDRGMRWMTWTFDPLQSRNANLNFEHLGAVSREYLVDFYGVMSGPLGSDASDRLVALWLLDSDRVNARAGAEQRTTLTDQLAADRGEHTGTANTTGPGARTAQPQDVWLLAVADLDASSDGEASDVSRLPTERLRTAVATQQETGRRSARLLVAAPPDVARLRDERPDEVKRWRAGIRAAIIPALDAGFQIVGFSGDAFVLEPRTT